MRHSGKAAQAGLRLILLSLIAVIVVCGFGLLARVIGSVIALVSWSMVVLWLLFAVFTLYFFRDPQPVVPSDAGSIVAPAHGKVDLIDETEEPEFVGGRCRRISIFLSVFDVHVQNAPVAGAVAYLKHTPGSFLNAMKTESAAHNENVLVGFDSTDKPGERIGVRLIAGLIARRIVPWVMTGDRVERGERISLIRFGSRCDIYLPLTVEVAVRLGEHVRGGETVVARRA